MRRLLWIYTIALGLSLISSAAFASASEMIRTTSYSSLPCSSPVKEYWMEGGNMHDSERAVNLVCPSGADTAKWIIMAGVSCSDGGIDDAMEKACNGPLAGPIGKFNVEQNEHTYDLGKYVLAQDCHQAKFTSTANLKYLGDKSGGIPSDITGWVCKTISKINGLRSWDDNGQNVGAKNFRYVHVVTRGDDGKQDDDGTWHLSILGVSDGDADYRVTYKNGKASVVGD